MTRALVLATVGLAGFASPGIARAEVILACTFPSLPTAIMRFPDDRAAPKTIELGGRPPVELTEGQGAGRLITASVDGYSFRFAPANSVMDVERDGAPVASEAGRCATIGGPRSEAPLQIVSAEAATATEATMPDTGAALPEPEGRWVVTEDTSTFDDTRTVVLSLESSEPIRSQFGAPGPAILYIRCMENTTVFYLWLNDLFLSDIQGYGVIDYRIDDQPASKVQAEGSTDNKALGLWGGSRSIPFLKEMISGKRVAFRATPFNESPVEFAFDLTGLDAAIAPLREACAW
jgi:invasion protein IalB